MEQGGKFAEDIFKVLDFWAIPWVYSWLFAHGSFLETGDI